MHSPGPRALRRAGTTLAVLAGGLVAAPLAQAADTGDDLADALGAPVAAVADAALPAPSAPSSSACADPVVEQPFAPFGDVRDYVLAPGGDFTAPAEAGWRTYGGASFTPTEQADGSTGGTLALPARSVAVSPPVCVDLHYGTARLWARGGRGSRVNVAVSYGRLDRTRITARLRPGAAWAPSDDIDVRPELGGATSGWRMVTFVIAADPIGATTYLDDLWVDPRMH